MMANSRAGDTTRYAAMTDEQLNRLVAERLGYSVEHVEFDNSNGYPCFGRDREWYWDYMHKGDEDCEPLGEWASSIDAAAALDFGDAVERVVITRRRDGYRVEVHSALNGRVLVDWFDAELARVWVIVWLRFKDWIAGA